MHARARRVPISSSTEGTAAPTIAAASRIHRAARARERHAGAGFPGCVSGALAASGPLTKGEFYVIPSARGSERGGRVPIASARGAGHPSRQPPMKRLLALFALAFPALFAFAACGDSNAPASSTGEDPALAACGEAPLCDSFSFPASCAFVDDTITCAQGDAGAGDAGDADAGDADAGAPSPAVVARLQCALEALRDRKTGGLALLVPAGGSPTCGIRVEIVSFGDGSASVLPVSYCDGEIARGTAARRAIQPASFFDTCLASDDVGKRFECLAAAIQKKAASGGACSCRGIAADPDRGLCSTQ
jgi:hypothetical protein